MKKKILPLLLGGSLALSAVFGFAACDRDTPNTPDDPTTGEVGDPTEAGTVYNAATAKDYQATREDTRSAMYSAYTPSGTKIGDYKALANAINAAIYYDADQYDANPEYTFGSYVTQINDTVKMFVNRQGYTSSNDECFWFYENGTSLDAFWCWDNTDTLGSLKNTKFITAHTQGYGTVPAQTYNSYGILDPNGDVSDTLNSPSYELSTTLDAAVIAFPKRFGGVTKMENTIDLSNVQLTPPYTTGDEASDVYAFMGFYSWQDYYVINVGIACDVTTGNWYAYEGSSRDDSASDITYNIGDCIMTSTWNEEGGYFEPDADSVTISIETVVLEDELGEYQVNDFTAAVEDGATYKRRLTSELVNNYFSGYELSRENSYVFVAGLDVKNEISAGVEAVNTDYFNGAEFLNMAISSARAYVPTEEEMSDVQYGYQIDASLRGQWHDMLLATGNRDSSYAGPIDYVVLNNNLCTTYDKSSGMDVYSFSYNMSAEGSDSLGSTAKEYQDVIDSLADVTIENVGDYEDDIAQVDEWYGTDESGAGSTLADKYRNVLDFTYYLAAKEVQLAAVELTPAAQVVVDAFAQLGNLSNYTYLGWTTDGDTIAGYMGSEIAAFRALKEDYDALSAEEQAAVNFHVTTASFNAWSQLSEQIAAMESNANYSDAGFTAYSTSGDGTTFTVTPANAIETLVAQLWLSGRSNITWDIDADFLAGELYLVTQNYLEGLGMEIPTLLADRFNALVTAGNCQIVHDYPAMQAAVELGTKYLAAMQDPLCITPAITEEDATIINQYFVAGWTYSDTGITWGLSNTWVFSASRVSNVVRYHRDPAYTGTVTYLQCLDAVIDVLVAHGYTADTSTTQPYKVQESAVTAHDAIELDLGDLSQEARAFYDAWLTIGDIKQYDIVGWTTDEADKTGYFWDFAQTAAAQQDVWDALSADDQAAVATFLSMETDALAAQVADWSTFVDEYNALLENTSFTGAASITTLTPPEDDAGTAESVTYTAEQALQEVIYRALRINVGDTWTGTANKIMDVNNSWYQSVLIVVLTEYLQSIDGVTLPAFVVDLLEAVEYDNFYDAYCAIRQTVELATAIEENGYVGTADLTEAELADLNTYWTLDYSINSLLSWNWLQGSKFQQYMSARLAYAVSMMGGDLTNASGTALRFFEYNDIVGQFLVENGYVLDTAKNGWGVTATTITAGAPIDPIPTVEATVESVTAAFALMGDLSDYTYVGWTSFIENTIAGYMGSELELFSRIQAAYAQLSASDQAAVQAAISMDSYNAWAAFAEDIAAIEASSNYNDAGITGYSTDGAGSTFTISPATVVEVLASELFKSGLTKIAWDYDSYPTYTIGELYLITEDYLSGLGIEMPALFADRFEALVAAGGCGIVQDYDALAAAAKLGTKWLAAMQNEAITAPAITEEDAALINQYFVSAWTYTDTGTAWALGNAGNEWIIDGARAANIVRYNKDASYTGSATLSQCYAAVMQVLAAHGYTPDPSLPASYPYKITESSVTAHDAIIDEEAAADAFYEAWSGIGDIEMYDIAGWTTSNADKTGYIWDVAQSVATYQEIWNGMSADAKAEVAALLETDAETVTAQIEAWMTFVSEYNALQANAAFTGAASITTITPRTGASTTLTSSEALQEIIYWSLRINLGDTWEGVANGMDGDNSWYQSIFITTLVEYVEDIDESIALPTFVQNVLTEIDYANFLDAYSAIRQTVELAMAIETNGYTTLADLTEEELADLNTYWTSGYTISAKISWNWISGDKFQMYMSARLARAVTVMGGTLTDGSGNALIFADYNDIVGSFLEANGYTLDTAKNGWGVTAAEIVAE